MKKTIKKLDNQVVKALTKACEQLKEQYSDFEWLTHSADFSNFPGSLMVYCIFTTEAAWQNCKQEGGDAVFAKVIHGELLRVGVLLKTPKRHVLFDSEQACTAQSNGNWKLRLKQNH
jgi:hypothetical protein